MRRSLLFADQPFTPYSIPSFSSTITVCEGRVADDPDSLAARAVVVRVDQDPDGVPERVVGNLGSDAVLPFHVLAALRPVDSLEHTTSVMHFITPR